MVEILLDVKKAFEHVNRTKLIEAAKAIGYPMHALVMSIEAYEWPCRLVFEGLASRQVTPTRGIAAGSAFAIFELECLLALVIASMAVQSLQSTFRLQVDG